MSRFFLSKLNHRFFRVFVAVLMIFVTVIPYSADFVNASAVVPLSLKFISDPVYKNSPEFYSGLAYVETEDNHLYIDASGKTVFDFNKALKNRALDKSGNDKFVFSRFYDDSFAIIRNGETTWALTKMGGTMKTKLPVFMYNEGFFSVYNKDNSDFKLINKNFDVVDVFATIKKAYGESLKLEKAWGLDRVSEGLLGFVIVNENNSADALLKQFNITPKNNSRYFAFADTTFKIKFVLDDMFTSARAFNQGLAPVRNSEGFWGFIDKDGKVSIKCEYLDFVVRSADDKYIIFSEDSAIVRAKNGRWQFIDKNSKILYNTNKKNSGGWRDISFFKNGMSIVKSGTPLRSFSYKADGGMFMTKVFDTITPLDDGYSLASNNKDYFFIDSKGNKVSDVIWNFDALEVKNSDFPHIFSYRLGNRWGVAVKTNDGGSTNLVPKKPVPKTDLTLPEFMFEGNVAQIDSTIVFDKSSKSYFLPFDELCKNLNAKLSYEDGFYKAELYEYGVAFNKDSKSYLVLVDDALSSTITKTDKAFTANKKAFVINSKLYVPVKEAVEALGFTYKIDELYNLILIER